MGRQKFYGNYSRKKSKADSSCPVVREHVYSRGKFVKKANHLANWVQVTSNSKKSDVAKFATCSEPI